MQCSAHKKEGHYQSSRHLFLSPRNSKSEAGHINITSFNIQELPVLGISIQTITRSIYHPHTLTHSSLRSYEQVLVPDYSPGHSEKTYVSNLASPLTRHSFPCMQLCGFLERKKKIRTLELQFPNVSTNQNHLRGPGVWIKW